MVPHLVLVVAIEGTVTDPNFGNGLYVGLTLNPASATGGNVPIATLSEIILEDNVNYNGDDFATANWNVSRSLINSPKTMSFSL